MQRRGEGRGGEWEKEGEREKERRRYINISLVSVEMDHDQGPLVAVEIIIILPPLKWNVTDITKLLPFSDVMLFQICIAASLK